MRRDSSASGRAVFIVEIQAVIAPATSAETRPATTSAISANCD